MGPGDPEDPLLDSRNIESAVEARKELNGSVGPTANPGMGPGDPRLDFVTPRWVQETHK
jgi:hypothetical protein